MKRITFLVLGQFLALALVASAASVGAAEVQSNVGSAPGYGVAMPVPVKADSYYGFIQFNNLVIESVSASNPPAEIVATNPDIYTIMGLGSGVSGGSMMAPTPSPTLPSRQASTCYKFNDKEEMSGTITCPVPPVIVSSTQVSTSSMPVPQIYPPPPNFRYQPYRIEVDSSTKLLLRDRTVATLSSFSSGDKINVYGYYNTDGSIQAYMIRNLSKPAQDEFIQLNNVLLVSVSTTTPNSLVVAQRNYYPCYGYNSDGTNKQSIACPMGIQLPANNSAMQNLSVPSALAPSWETLRKYVVNIDAQTVILDNNRTQLQLSSLQVGDELNVYGDTTDGGQTLNADIIRDISLPPRPSSYSGSVTQVSTDGSFVIQTDNGQTITVQSPIKVGVVVQLTGILDRLSSVISEVSNFYIVNKTQPPVPRGSGSLRINGSEPSQAQSEMPNARN